MENRNQCMYVLRPVYSYVWYVCRVDHCYTCGRNDRQYCEPPKHYKKFTYKQAQILAKTSGSFGQISGKYITILNNFGHYIQQFRPGLLSFSLLINASGRNLK